MPSDSSTAGFAKLRHDLRTCVNQILGYAGLLKEEAEDIQPDFVPDLDRIDQAARRLLGLLDGIFADSVGSEPARGKPKRETDPPVSTSDSEAEPSGRILVVDDNEMNRDMLSRRLARAGYEVELAEGGREALHRIEQGNLDLVLLDVMMPEISGYDVLASVRGSRIHADLPIIMATAKGESEDIVTAFELGANDYVTKPLDFGVVLARVRTQIAMRRTVLQNQALAREVEIRNRFIRQTFGRYVTDEVVATLLEDRSGLQLGGEKRRLTILMSDLRGFSSISERYPAETVVAVINNYLEVMTDVILDLGGTIDEFIGDAILVIFGAPVGRDDHARAAVRCAIRMQRAMDEVNRRNLERGLPALAMGIGIHTGDVVVGNIGSEKRTKYGVVGSNVNLTSRIESYTTPGQILLSNEVLTEAGGGITVGRTLEVQPKGYSEPIPLFEILGIEEEGSIENEKSEMVRLAEPMPCRLSQVRGKDTSGAFHGATVVRTSLEEMLIQVPIPLDPLANVKILLGGDDTSPLAEAYGKVIGPDEREGGTVLIRFTSLSPEAERGIADALQKTAGG